MNDENPLRSIVTGGAGALGQTIISALVARGDRVICLDRRPPRSEHTDFIEVDVADRLSVNGAIDAAVNKLGGVDVLIHAAGIMKTAAFCDLDDGELAEHLNINMMGAFRVAQRTVKHMSPNGGRIVFITSIHGQLGVPGRSAYAASKGAIASLARVMAAELAEQNIRVNVLAPGAIDGGMSPDSRSRQGWLDVTPSNRVAHLSEVAAMATVLTSFSASFVTGQVVAIDGGASTVKAFGS
ncbi:3-oxoacyl-[acyl-carrier protein] reductase [Epibacterium ulvae]|uniref:3-oxoacyl-[acyl-carrier protein] reductase n=1 Tax=Epibacterium ulvae TaxID=1156985 RepID=A0A1G5R212_9RHOB|nr:SDR family oxidoreductase [Epibacterium ulvae]SCZ68135.1 3-oxoacyl-[acyl-carrier protein] reductase [Epibacterium ulvae]